jgi:hypothetical protein
MAEVERLRATLPYDWHAHALEADAEAARLTAEVEWLKGEVKKWKKLDAEAAEYVEVVICMRTRFTGDHPYVGWKGLGLALNEELDERDALRLAIEQLREENRLLTDPSVDVVTLAKQNEAEVERHKAAHEETSAQLDRILLSHGKLTAENERLRAAIKLAMKSVESGSYLGTLEILEEALAPAPTPAPSDVDELRRRLEEESKANNPHGF